MAIPMHDLQRADRGLGSLAALALQPARALRRRAAPVRDVLVVKVWGLGSLQVATPAFDELRRLYPQARRTLLTLASHRPFAEGLGQFDAVWGVELGGASWPRLLGRLARLAHAVRRRRFDLVLDLEFLTRFSAVLACASGAPRTRGFCAPGDRRAGLHTTLVPFRRDRHVASNFRALVLGYGADDEPVRPEAVRPFRIVAKDRLEATLALLEAGLAGPGPLVVLNPNAGPLSHDRRWPARRFAELARRLVVEDGARVALVGAKHEAAHTRRMRALAGPLPAGRVVDLSGRLSLGGLVALLRETDAFVTNDSGPMHVAAAQGVPTLGLFGPETPALYRPLGQRARALYVPSACSPCIRVDANKLGRCPLARPECLENLSVGYVLAATRDELGRPRRDAADEALAPPRETTA